MPNVSDGSIANAVAADVDTDDTYLVIVDGVLKEITADEQAKTSALTSRYPSLFLPASALSAVNGSPTNTGLPTSTWAVWLLDAATVEAVAGGIVVPPNWATVNIDVWWANAGAGAGDVIWRIYHLDTAIDATLNSVTTTDVAGTAGAQYILKRTQVVAGASVTPGRFLAVQALRLATHVNDTLANDAGLVGVEIVRAS